MNTAVRFAAGLLCPLLIGAVWAGPKTAKIPDLDHLDTAQAERLLNDSPWAVPGGATIVTPKLQPGDRDIPLPTPTNQPAQGPSYASDANGVDDGKWDGGVGKLRKGEPPRIPVLVRWDSSSPLRAALLKTHDPAAHDTEHSLVQPEKDYIIEVIGLIPARRQRPGDGEEAAESGPSPRFDLNQLRNGLAATTRLLRRGKPAIAPEDVHFDEATGLLQIYFPRKDPILPEDKEVIFRTSFGSLQVVQRFRLKDMIYRGRLEL